MATACWSDERIQTLLIILKEKNIVSQLDSCKRNEAIFKEVVAWANKRSFFYWPMVVAELALNGFTYSIQQVRAKVKGLKSQWKSIRDNNNRSGKDRKTCKYFEAMEELWGNRPSARPFYEVDNFMQSSKEKDSPQNIFCEIDDDVNIDSDAIANCMLMTMSSGSVFESVPSNSSDSPGYDITSSSFLSNESIDSPPTRKSSDSPPTRKSSDSPPTSKSSDSASILASDASTSSFKSKSSTSLTKAKVNRTASKETDCISSKSEEPNNEKKRPPSANNLFLAKKSKVSKMEQAMTNIVTKFQEHSEKQQEVMIAAEKCHQKEFLDALLKFEKQELTNYYLFNY